MKEETELQRLSLRDLLWYCYLDQDTIDSDFFNLTSDANNWKRLKSREVLRFVIGFHQEHVAELESELVDLQTKRRDYTSAAEALKAALASADVESEEEIVHRIGELGLEVERADLREAEIRAQQRQNLPVQHGVDSLRDQARSIADELESLDQALDDVREAMVRDERYRNELLMLGVKANRAAAARAVLGGVEFDSCPRCAQVLPEREDSLCPVCAQPEPVQGALTVSSDILEADAKARVAELDDSIVRHRTQVRRMLHRREEFSELRVSIDREISRTMRAYDTAFLSALLENERHRASINQQIQGLRRLVVLPRKVDELRESAAELQAREILTRERLVDARKEAERDQRNLRRLEVLFLDCLVRAELPGIDAESTAHIKSPSFLPEVQDKNTGDLAVTSFSNISSGGKKTLFKACFALAFHRLATEVGAMLPSLLIIDSPMKNISERENREQFLGFYRLMYELAEGELSDTQFILIDKEDLPPYQGELEPLVRYMTPDNDNCPPLIPYYRGA